MLTRKSIQFKTLSIVLTLMMIVTAFAGMSTTAFAAAGDVWDGESVDTTWYSADKTAFTIDDAKELAGLAAIVNGTADGIAQDDFAGKTVTLGADILLNRSNRLYASKAGRFGSSQYGMSTIYYAVQSTAKIWTPIGSADASSNTTFANQKFFCGTFDGAGHTVTGLYTDGSKTVQGLFGSLGEGAAVKDVTVEGCVTAKIVAGGIAAYIKGASITGCTNKAIVYADGGQVAGSGEENGVSRGGGIGGIAGVATGTAKKPATLESCSNEGPIVCTNTAKGGRVGGILGLVDNESDIGSVTKCVNKGSIEAYQYAGGMIGLDGSKNFPIESCANLASTAGYSSGMAYVGGITGSGNSSITNCYNTATFGARLDDSDREDVGGEERGTKVTRVAGIAGSFSGAKGTIEITNCYNTGSVKVGENDTYSSTGGICGSGYGDSVDNSLLVNCYCLSGTGYDNSSNGAYVTIVSESELKSEEMIGDLGDAYRYVEGSYPILNWQ